MINGYIIQRDLIGGYKGVEGDNWFLNDIYPEDFDTYFSNNIERSWFDTNYVDVCADNSFLKKYIERSKLNDINFRVLLCETEKEKPTIQKIIGHATFIGYDYAYSGGSYYSAVLNDVYARRVPCFSNYKLNSSGLFNAIGDLKDFILKRELYLRNHKDILIEAGDFIIYKLYEITVDNGFMD